MFSYFVSQFVQRCSTGRHG
uniref:Uncharacterized protein n=1 Tax=Anguilla anguilla TaxID=7936 RepID=A0A0E9Q117_ANGAN